MRIREYGFLLMILMICVLLPFFPNAAKADGRGENKTVTVSLPALVTDKALSVTVTYDANVLSLTSGAWLFGDAAMKGFDLKNGTGVIGFTEEKKLSGQAFSLSYQIKSDAPFGDTVINVVFRPEKSAALTVQIPVSVVCAHDYQTAEEKKATCENAGYLIQKCRICQAEKTTELPQLSHSFSSWTNLGQSHMRKCTLCGAQETGNHTIGAKWYSDAANHYRTCTVCGLKSQAAAHTPGKEATTEAPQTCTVCGRVLQNRLPEPTEKESSACESEPEPSESEEESVSAEESPEDASESSVCESSSETETQTETETETAGETESADETTQEGEAEEKDADGGKRFDYRNLIALSAFLIFLVLENLLLIYLHDKKKKENSK